MQNGFCIPDNQCVARVVSALETYNGASPFCQQVNEFAFALVSPLRTNYYCGSTHVAPPGLAALLRYLCDT